LIDYKRFFVRQIKFGRKQGTSQVIENEPFFSADNKAILEKLNISEQRSYFRRKKGVSQKLRSE